MNQTSTSPAVVRFFTPEQQAFWLSHLAKIEAKVAAEREAKRAN